MALPLAMALGIASGASPNQGLVTAVIAGFLISLLGGSRVQIGGPGRTRRCEPGLCPVRRTAGDRRHRQNSHQYPRRFAGPMFFGVAREMLDALRRTGRSPKAIILRMERVPYIDSSGASALEAFVRQAHGEGTKLILCDLRDAKPGGARQPHYFFAFR